MKLKLTKEPSERILKLESALTFALRYVPVTCDSTLCDKDSHCRFCDSCVVPGRPGEYVHQKTCSVKRARDLLIGLKVSPW